MAKKVKVDVGNLFLLAASLIGIAAFCMVFLTAVKGTGKYLGTEPSYVGTQVVFGYKDGDTAILYFNFMALLSLFILPLIAAMMTAVSVVLKKKTFYISAAVMFLLGGIMAFFTVASFKSGVVSGTYYDLYDWTLGVGAILSGIFSILSALVIGAKEILKY